MSKMAEKAIVAYLELLSQYLPEGTEENYEDAQSGWSVSRPLSQNCQEGLRRTLKTVQWDSLCPAKSKPVTSRI
jgi:hypothetical protein